MRTIQLITVASGDDGTFGVLVENGIPLNFRTLERPWRNNAHGISCIPAGTYTVKKEVFPKHGLCWHVTDVPGRDAILIHTGNTELDVEGCILLGVECGSLLVEDPDTGKQEYQPAVLRSKEAIAQFDIALGGIDFLLEVKR